MEWNKKDICAYVQEDLAGHLERSGEALRMHGDPRSDLSAEQRKDYFYGMTTVFPLMFLGHYYDWLTDGESGKDWPGFCAAQEKEFGELNRTMLDRICRTADDPKLWAAAVSSYLSYYPYAILNAFAEWGCLPEQREKARSFICADRMTVLPELVERLVSCAGEPEARTQTIFWLGTQFPYELLKRFHEALF